MRVIDSTAHASGNRFSAIYIKNTGVDKRGWWHYYNVTVGQIKDLLKQKKARLIELERKSSKRLRRRDAEAQGRRVLVVVLQRHRRPS